MICDLDKMKPLHTSTISGLDSIAAPFRFIAISLSRVLSFNLTTASDEQAESKTRKTPAHRVALNRVNGLGFRTGNTLFMISITWLVHVWRRHLSRAADTGMSTVASLFGEWPFSLASQVFQPMIGAASFLSFVLSGKSSRRMRMT